MSQVNSEIPSGFRKVYYLRFKNCTRRNVSLKIHYYRKSINLKPGKHFDIVTSKDEIWISKDVTTSTRMLLNNNTIFYPSSTAYRFPTNRPFRNYMPVVTSIQDIMCDNFERVYVCITLPVLSLREICAETVFKSVKSFEDVERLPTSPILQNVIKSYFVNDWY